MSDLIDKDKVINAIVRNCRLKTENGEEYGFIDILSDIVDFPTAYDVDKVVEEIREYADSIAEMGGKFLPKVVIEVIKSCGAANE